jgi:hypothetical protein
VSLFTCFQLLLICTVLIGSHANHALHYASCTKEQNPPSLHSNIKITLEANWFANNIVLYYVKKFSLFFPLPLWFNFSCFYENSLFLRRLLLNGGPKEFYVCYQDTAAQNMVELAFKLGFGSPLW